MRIDEESLVPVELMDSELDKNRPRKSRATTFEFLSLDFPYESMIYMAMYFLQYFIF